MVCAGRCGDQGSWFLYRTGRTLWCFTRLCACLWNYPTVG